MPVKRNSKSRKTNKRSFKKRSLSKRKNQRGGSEASNLVMEALGQPVMNDYISEPRIRTDGDSSCQSGGSTASDMVTSQLNEDAKSLNYAKGMNVDANINSLNLYATSGGFRKQKRNKKSKKHSKKHSKNNKKNKKSKKSYKRKNHIMKGGSDWISSQYSLGDINGNSMNTSTNNFSAAQGVSRDILMNPPTMGLAGSGYPTTDLEGANVRAVGAPLV